MSENTVTLIDLWELPEERIDESVERWRERVRLIHTAPGFRDARLHRRISSESRFGLVNVAHWDSVEARDRALSNPNFVASAATAASYATVRGGWYRVVGEVRAERGGREGGAGVTLVVAFESPAERVDEFPPHWLASGESLSTVPGFRDARLHRAVAPGARFPLVTVAHWDSLETWRTAVDDPGVQSWTAGLADAGVAHSGLFRIAAEF